MPIMAQSADGVMHRFPDGTAQSVVDAAMKKYAQENPQPANDDNLSQAGAPLSVRAVVGAMPDNPQDRLQAIRKFYPDAQPHGADNFTFTDPQTGRQTLYNPEGLDWGDIASLAPEVGEFLGGVGGAVTGAAGGSAVAPGAGTVVGGIAGAGVGATAGREAVQRTAMTLAGVKDVRSAKQQLKDAATTFAFNSAGQGAGELVGAGLRAGVKGVMRGGAAGRTATQQAIADLDRFGATPSVAQATQNSALDSVESLTAKVPGGAGVIRQAAQKQSQQVAKAVSDKLAALNSNVAPDTLAAGKAAQRGVEDFARNFQDRADVLYGKVDQFIPSDAPIKAANTERTLGQIVNPVKGASNVNTLERNPYLANLADALGKDSSNNAVTYGVLKDLRSSIGRRLGSPQLVSDAPRADLKRVYGALTDDLRIAAQGQGPDALKAFDRATKFYQMGMDHIDTMLTPLVRGDLPGQVFRAVETASKQEPTRLLALRQSVNPEQWRVIASAVADKLGRAVPGQQGVEVENFSFQYFLKNWQRLPEQSRRVLFSGPKMNGISGDLNALARASERIRDSSKAFANPSGTAGASTGNAMLFGALGSAVTGDVRFLGTVMAAMGASHAGAKLLTSKPFVHWLAQATTIKPAGIAAHIGRLGAIAANSDADTRNAIGGYLTALGEQEQQP